MAAARVRPRNTVAHAAAELLFGGTADLVLAALLRPHLAHPAGGWAGQAERGTGRSFHHSVAHATGHTRCKRGSKPVCL